MNILFICSRNEWRSRTAETIFKNHPVHQIRSAGTEPSARIKVTERLIQWADLVFVMEKRHRDRLKEQFGQIMNDRDVVILDIPDDYKYMDEGMVEILRAAVKPVIE